MFGLHNSGRHGRLQSHRLHRPFMNATGGRGLVWFLLYSAEVRLYRVTGTLPMGARSFDRK